MKLEGILPKRPYPPCLPMADRALSAGYPWIMGIRRWFIIHPLDEICKWKIHLEVTLVKGFFVRTDLHHINFVIFSQFISYFLLKLWFIKSFQWSSAFPLQLFVTTINVSLCTLVDCMMELKAIKNSRLLLYNSYQLKLHLLYIYVLSLA